MDTYIINNHDDFHKWYPLLKNTAKVGSVPDIYLVGMDIETFSKDNFPKSFENAKAWVPMLISKEHINYNNNNKNIACIIQLCSNKLCLIINLVKLKGIMPKKLVSIIKNDSWVKVGVGIELDLSILSDNYNLGHCSGGIEIKNLALLAHYKNPNLEALFSQFIGNYTKKTSSICDWSQELTESQLLYAARDSIMSLQIFNHIIKPSIDNLISIKNESDTKLNNILKIKFNNLNTNAMNMNMNNNNINTTNYIGNLNEYAQKNKLLSPIYEDKLIEDHKYHQQNNLPFSTLCKFNNIIIEGLGDTKKDARQNAAKQILQYYQTENRYSTNLATIVD
jgi:hypothetical protein